MYNRGTKYLEKGNALKALQFFKKEENSFKELHLNMGSAYRMLMKTDKAVEQYNLANSSSTPFADGTYICTAYPLALNNIGLIAYACGDDETAISYYKAALTLDPLHYDAIWNYSSAMLRMHNCSSKEGWKAYEYRFKRSGKAVVIDTSVPRWDGVTGGDAICVQTEQGLGDKIMFGRYLSHLKKYFNEVYVSCHPSLDVFFSDYKIVRSVKESGCEVTVGLCSFAQWFGIVSERYLDGKFVARTFDPRRLNVGVVWSGSSSHANDHNRSCPSYLFSNLSRPDIKLYGLNPDAGSGKNIENIATKDWTSTAEALLGLDCVVSVDTSIVHLCGTLGVPCIMIQPTWETDFRWGNGVVKNVWYSSVEVVHNPGWETVMPIVANKLEALRKSLAVRLITGRTEAEWVKHIEKEENAQRS